jgi:hypothetical protein
MAHRAVPIVPMWQTWTIVAMVIALVLLASLLLIG